MALFWCPCGLGATLDAGAVVIKADAGTDAQSGALQSADDMEGLTGGPGSRLILQLEGVRSLLGWQESKTAIN